MMMGIVETGTVKISESEVNIENFKVDEEVPIGEARKMALKWAVSQLQLALNK